MKKKNMGKKIVLGILLVIIIIMIVAYLMFAQRIQSALSVKKLEDTLYTIEFQGDYGFDKFIAKGGATTNGQMANYIMSFLSNGFYTKHDADVDSRTFGCSAFKGFLADGTAIYGRNYDWEPCDTMIIHTFPDNGYESISTCCINFLGFGEDYLPEGFGNQFLSIASIYVPMDGMNEKGVVIADLMAGDSAPTHQEGRKGDFTPTSAIRLVLDHAATVDEALELLSQYDMHSVLDSAQHFFIGDRNGNSVVVEYIDNEMIVTPTNAVTNHYLASAKAGIGSQNSHDRYDHLLEAFERTSGQMTIDELAGEMKAVSVGQMPDINDPTEKTDWTCCYNTKDMTVDFYYMENYDQKYSITLGKKGDWIVAK